VLGEEFQEIDIPYGCIGQIPLSNFQTIMIDYDIPLVDFDVQELRKKSFMTKDSQGNEYVKYQSLLEEVKPKQVATTDLKTLTRLVTKVQASWRAFVCRKQYAKM